MSNTFKTGDKVRLKSGGPEMELWKITEKDDELIFICRWDDGKALQIERYHWSEVEHA
ncbi:hypothetical protein BN1086_02107 [Citrobacter koseri]|uniref:DUF2158 domain-containing protein n=1 Tax=Citrobacter koseri TaxID=545 RepID=A0A078LJC5_CITKO|nr:hypothetical protein BN1086_02107 [Citrobacter koseri]